MTNIKLRTVGQKVGVRTNARKPDLDHAQTILEYLEKGYRITASAETTPMWTVSFSRGLKGKLFVNQEGADENSENLLKRVNYGNDDGRLYDDQPDWVDELFRLVCLVTQPNTYWH
tara:strand:- start:1990 stop:2337 length:348 start_codon:yes stop_codon:yes gene_type:complete